ncbi:hypothetical protein VTN00DRAFT_5447 [Thermoascus crustaceus]|uniref:uncharacterized protein n=1 Tax=Thermoascus crustaceus TaxID=5088 RepID=UPI0037446AF7
MSTMSSSPTESALSQTLQSITLTKIRELEKQRHAYDTRKNQILAERWLDQARYDSSIPDHVLRSFEEQLRSKLEIQSRKLSLADLYSRLLTEWTNPSMTKGKDVWTSSASSSEENEFEVVQERQNQRLQQLCDQFESVVFTPLETDEAEIHAFMRELFPDDDESTKALEDLRQRIREMSTAMLAEEVPFTEDSLAWCIKGLLTENLLGDEKQAILRDFLQNKVALADIADVLNMWYADIKNWNWHAGEERIPVMPRQQLNGKYRIWMDEDVLQTIFVQYVGIRLCVLLKAALRDFIGQQKSGWNWTNGVEITQRDTDRRIYYLGVSTVSDRHSVESTRRSEYINRFSLSQLPTKESTLSERGGGYDECDDKNNEGGRQSSIKQQLLRKIASEFLLQRRLHGKVAFLQSDIQWFTTSLAHSTIFAVMRFMGFPEDWITFFKKYLEAPLNMDRASEDRVSMGPRIRKRGVPMAHASEKFLGELVLFVLNLAVNRKTGMLLYRLHDDLWLCGEPEKCARAWEVMQQFAKVMGLEYNRNKTGSVYLTEDPIIRDPKVAAMLPNGPVTIGFLNLDPRSGNWVIDQKQVDAHVAQLRKQLDACDSVLSWVKTWNSCIGRFFSHTFGEPAYCFGRQHVDSILETYERMQRILFDGRDGRGANVTQHLKHMIYSRFSVSDIPDAFFFVPEELGGLGLRNPEREKYRSDKKEFDELGERGRLGRFRRLYPEGRSIGSTEACSVDLQDLYLELMDVPHKQDIHLTREVKDALVQQRRQLGLSPLDSTNRWILQMYADELLAQCGGLSLVEKRFLPVGVLNMMRGKKVTWQMVL